MRRIKRQAAVAAALAVGMVGAAAVHAQDANSSYIGFSVGQSDPSDNDLDSDTGFRLLGGYMFTPNWGVEVGYMDAGEFDGPGNRTTEVDGAYIAGVGAFSASDRMRIFGKLGLMHYGIENFRGGNQTFEDDGTELMFGLGGDYYVTDRLALGLEYNRVNDVDEIDVDNIWLNLRYDLGM
ncbi:MAG: porin family protein [Gammaproteobacteria bacterium]|nr:porin family protein [Gammaproteobacteria bacterium]